MHDGANDLVAAVLLVWQEAQDVHGVLGGRKQKKKEVIIPPDSQAAAESLAVWRSSHIRGHQLLSVVQVLHRGHALGAEVVVVRVG